MVAYRVHKQTQVKVELLTTNLKHLKKGKKDENEKEEGIVS